MRFLFNGIVKLLHYAIVIAILGVVEVVFLAGFAHIHDPLNVLLQASEKIFQVPNGEYYLAGIALILFLIEVEIVILRFREKKEGRYLTLKYSNGKVVISLKALEDFIKKICRGFSEIKDLFVSVKNTSGRIKVHLNVNIWSGYNVLNFSGEAQKHIKSQLLNILGLDNEVEVTIKVIEVDENRIEVFQDKMYRGLEIQ